MSQTCIMIRTGDQRKFFTHEENYPELIKFSKTLGAEISLVEIENEIEDENEEPKILSLDQLAPAICNTSYNIKCPEFKVVQIKVPRAGRKKKLTGRAKMRENASRVRAYVESELLLGNRISLKEVSKKFNDLDLSAATVCNHISRVRQELDEKGYKVKKEGSTYFI